MHNYRPGLEGGSYFNGIALNQTISYLFSIYL